MRHNILTCSIGVFALLASILGGVQCVVASEVLTAREQSLLLRASGMSDGRIRSAHNAFLADLEATVRRANPGADSQSLRRPVPESAVRLLQVRSAARGDFASIQELRAATDYAHSLLGESPGQTLAAKVARLPTQERKAFHGKVAELAEARARGLVLTKSRFSPTWDLTETRFQPRNYQMKIYAQHDMALASVLDDLDSRFAFEKRGILTKATLEHGVSSGALRRTGDTYRPIARPDVELVSSRIFSRPAESHIYAHTGRESLIRHGLPASETAPRPLQAGGSWLIRASIVSLLASEVYVVHRYASGSLSERDFGTTQLIIVGGAAGGWGGATIGALVGTLGGPLAWFTVPLGGLVGGLLGGYTGAELANRFAAGWYGRLDAREQRAVEAFIYKRYGVSDS